MVIASNGVHQDLIGNPVRIRNCPRNCMCGRNGMATGGESLHGTPLGRTQSRTMHESGDLPCLEVSCSSGC